MFYLERKWKENVSQSRNNGMHDPRMWATQGGNDILDLDLSNFGIIDTRSELHLILLFKLIPKCEASLSFCLDLLHHHIH